MQQKNHLLKQFLSKSATSDAVIGLLLRSPSKFVVLNSLNTGEIVLGILVDDAQSYRLSRCIRFAHQNCDTNPFLTCQASSFRHRKSRGAQKPRRSASMGCISFAFGRSRRQKSEWDRVWERHDIGP